MMEMKVNGFFEFKKQQEALRYNMLFNITRRTEDGAVFHDDDDNVYIEISEVLAESAKAIKVRVATGDTDGSAKGFVTWFPKSCATILKYEI